MRFWGLNSCDTCRRALAELRAAGWAPELVDVRADGVQTADLQRFYAKFGEALVNRRSTTWRGLDESARAGDPVLLLTAHPTLMKRPVIEANGQRSLGWDAETRALWLGKPAARA